MIWVFDQLGFVLSNATKTKLSFSDYINILDALLSKIASIWKPTLVIHELPYTLFKRHGLFVCSYLIKTFRNNKLINLSRF